LGRGEWVGEAREVKVEKHWPKLGPIHINALFEVLFPHQRSEFTSLLGYEHLEIKNLSYTK
jgi:hypothetical protein